MRVKLTPGNLNPGSCSHTPQAFKIIILYIELSHNLDQTQTTLHITQQKRELRLKLIRFIIYLGLLIRFRPLYIIKSYFNNM